MYYTEEELENIRKAIIEMNERAKSIAKARGIKMHPRIETANLD